MIVMPRILGVRPAGPGGRLALAIGAGLGVALAAAVIFVALALGAAGVP